MLKKIMFYIMMIATVVKFAGLTFLFSTDAERLPNAIYVVCGGLVLFGIFLICKNIIKSVTQKALVTYYCASTVAVIFNLMYMKWFTRVELIPVDLMVIGTVMDIVVGVTFVFMAMKQRKYVHVSMKSGS